ncbi:MFS transporter [Paraburkholderia nodosa]|uniref:MFS transporter n=1 Tax=Paraburkholderia nodosa TaxID=392320 RepID=UPI0004B0631C|nr:MFS transporter [Paraburkholderia nodosa]
MSSTLPHDPTNRKKHDSVYEIKTLVLLGLGFGLVGLDRWMVAPLFPHMMRDLNLNFQQLGSLIGILSVAWGVWAIAMGPVSDRIGRKKILVVSMVAFSLLSSLSGLASGFAGLMLIRAVMGVAEGAFTPASVAATGEASLPSRRGFNQGLQLSMFSLLGLGFAPILVTQLLRIVPSWHWVFMISAVPGLIVALLIARTLRDKPASELRSMASAPSRPRWTAIFGSRNVWLATLAILCAMTGIFVVSAMVPTYLVEVLHLDTQQMGFVVSAIGFGGFVGSFGVAGISDFIGRRNAALIAFVGAAVLLYLFARTGADPLALFGLLFGVSVFALGLLGLLSGPIATEAAPAGLIASSIGFVSGAGEIFGGGLAPVIAGFVAQHFGLPSTLTFAFGGLVAGAVVSLFLAETSPRQRGAATPVAATGVPEDVV